MNIRVNLDTSQLERQAGSARKTITTLGDATEEQGKRMREIFTTAGAAMAGAFALQRIKSFVSEIINVRSEIQALSVSFETLLGSKQKADELFGQIRRYAATTPMQMNDLASGAQTLLGFNIEAQKVMPIMKAIGDISMGNRDKFNSLTLSFAQMSATGKLMGQDLLQMINAGFNPLTELAAKTGKSVAQLKDDMSAGSISAKMVEEAFLSATAAGGKFHGMLEAQSKTLSGSISNLQGAFSDMLNDFGEASEGIIAGGVNTAYELVLNYKETGEALMALIATFGVYKAAVIANEAMEAAALDTLHAKMAAIGEVNAVQATGFELEVQNAVASGNLTVQQGEEILTNYELAKARVVALNAAAAQAETEYAAATAVATTANANLAAADAMLLSAQQRLATAEASAVAADINAAQQEVELATTMQNTAATEAQTAAKALKNAEMAKDTALTTANTAAQELNTISLTAEAKGTAFLTLAKQQLTGAVAKLWAVMTAHPLAALLAAVAALGYGIYKLCTYTSDAEKAQQKLNKAIKDGGNDYVREEQNLKELNNALKTAKKGSENWQNAKQALIKQYGSYHNGLEKEIDKVGYLSKTYQELTTNIRASIAARKMAEAIDGDTTESDAVSELQQISETFSKRFRLKKNGKDAWANGLSDTSRTILMKEISDYVFGNADKFSEANAPMIRNMLANNKTAKGSSFLERIEVLRRNIAGSQDKQLSVAMALGFSAEDAKSILLTGKPVIHAGDEEQTTNYSEDLKKKKKAMDDAKKEWQKLKKSTTSTTAEVDAAKAAYKSAKDAYDEALGSSLEDKGKTAAEIAAERTAANQALLSSDEKAYRERLKAIRAQENEIEQARIDAMAEGTEKALRQRTLDNTKDQQALDDELNEAIDAEVQRQKALFEAKEKLAGTGKKNYAEKTFNPGSLTTFAPGDILDTDREDTGDLDTAPIKAILARYALLQSLLEQKQAKTRQEAQAQERESLNEYLVEYGSYEEKRLAIATKYAALRAKATTDGERMKLAREEQDAIDNLDFEDFMSNRASLAFGKVEDLTKETISALILEMEKYRGKVTQTFDPDKIEKFNKALDNLKRAQAQMRGGLISRYFTPDFYKQRAEAKAQRDSAAQTYSDLLGEKSAKQAGLGTVKASIAAYVKKATGKDLTDAQIMDGTSVSGIISTMLANGDKTGAADLSAMNEELGSARSELGKVSTAADEAGEKFQQLDESFKLNFTGLYASLAKVQSALEKVNEAAQGARDTVCELAETVDALGTDTSVGSGWDQAKTMFGAFADSTQGITDAFASLKSGNIMGVVSGLTKSVTSWIKGFAAIHDARLEKTIQTLQDEIDQYDRMNNRIERRLQKEYSKTASNSYKEEIENLEKQKQLIEQQIAAEESKKNTDNDRIKEWEDKLEEIGDTIEDYKDKALDAIIGEDISTSIDNFADALADAWGKTADRAKATKDYVKSMLKQMVLEAMKTDLSAPISKLREMMSAAMNDDVVTAAEQKELENYVSQMWSSIEQKYSWADSLMQNSSSQSGATTGTFATASQDSIDELSGRAAAIQTCGELRRQLLESIGIDTAAIRAQIAQGQENAAEIRNLTLLAVGHLETIARNTHELYGVNEKLEKIEKNTRGL